MSDSWPGASVPAEVARRLVAARLRGSVLGTPLTDSGTFSLDDAYAVQREVTALRLGRGERVVGWKLGYTSLAMRAQLGIEEPNLGPRPGWCSARRCRSTTSPLSQVALRYGRRLEAGQVVITGGLTAAVPLGDGSLVAAEFTALGAGGRDARVEVTPRGVTWPGRDEPHAPRTRVRHDPDMTHTLLHLVRHAEPDHGGDGEATGSELTARGRAQAAALGARLAGPGVDVVLHGPLPRARQTAEVLADAVPGVPVLATGHLADRTPLPTAIDAVPDRYRPFVDQARAESPDEIDPDGAALDEAVAAFSAARVSATVETLLGRPVAPDVGEPLRLVLVTHAFVVGWFVRHALDAPAWRWMGLNPSHASLTTLQVRGDGPTTLVAFDDLEHLGSALRSGVVAPRP